MQQRRKVPALQQPNMNPLAAKLDEASLVVEDIADLDFLHRRVEGRKLGLFCVVNIRHGLVHAGLSLQSSLPRLG